MPAFVDSETKSSTPISYGTDAYTKSATALIWTWALDEGEPGCWDVTDEPIPAAFEDIVLDERIPLIAHNAPFDRGILTHANKIETPIERWRCTRAMAYSSGLPGHLGLLGTVLQLPQDKQKLVEDGKLMHTFCIPQADGSFISQYDRPVEWERFKGYAVRDTVALREIHRRLPTYNYQGANLETWWLDQLINERGFGFDTALAHAAVEVLAAGKVISDKKIGDATDGAAGAATQREKLLRWLIDVKGLVIPNMRAATIREQLEQDDLDPLVRFVLETRLEAAKSAGSKYNRGLQMRSADDRLRQLIQFSGAGRTGRSSHKGFQPGNMARPTVKAAYIDDVIIPGIMTRSVIGMDVIYGGPNEACANALRGSIIAAPGNELVVADFANVESRDLAWLANEVWKLDAYRAVDRGEGVDLYRLLYARFFGVDVAQVDDHARQSGKVVELACGFGGSVGAFVTMAAGYNIDLDTLPSMVIPAAKPENLKKAEKAWRRAFLSLDDYGLDKDVFVACHLLVQAYREANKAINQLRHDLDRAVKDAVRNPGSSSFVGRCTTWCNGSTLIIQLPSGRRLNYWVPKLHTELDVDPETGKETRREYLSYATNRGQTWLRERAWSGLFLENIVQASSNDLLRDAQRAVHKDTLTVPAIADYLATLPRHERTAICLHIHDELALDVPRGSYPLERLIDKMIHSSPWAKGLPLAAAGWINQRYGKR